MEPFWKVVANWKTTNAVQMWSHRWLIWQKRKAFNHICYFRRFQMKRFSCSVDPKTFEKSDCQRISVIFEQHSYTICLSNKRVYVAKRLNSQLHRSGSATYSTPAVAFQSSNQSVATAIASGGSETDEPSTSNAELAWAIFGAFV